MKQIWRGLNGDGEKIPFPNIIRAGTGIAFPTSTPFLSPIIFCTYFFVLIYIETFHENYFETCFCDVGNMTWIIFGFFYDVIIRLCVCVGMLDNDTILNLLMIFGIKFCLMNFFFLLHFI